MKRNGWVETGAAGLLLLLIVVMAFWQLTSNATGGAANALGALENREENGSSQLFGWLAQQGYQMRVANESLTVSGDEALLFILAPERPLSPAELEQVNQWVFNGGTLILAHGQRRPTRLFDRFELNSFRLWRSPSAQPLNLPTYSWPFVGAVTLDTRFGLRVNCGQVVVHLGDCRQAHFISQPYGRGQLIVFSSAALFTNESLLSQPNAQLVQNIITLSLPAGGTIVVDEAHRAGGLSRVWQSRVGLLLVATAVLLMLYLLWQNRPFFTPTPPNPVVVPDVPHQSSSAFINELALAQRELDPNGRIREHYWRQLKRRFAARHGLDPAMDDEQFMHQVNALEQEETVGKLIYIYQTSIQQNLTEIGMLQWTAVTLDMIENPPKEPV